MRKHTAIWSKQPQHIPQASSICGSYHTSKDPGISIDPIVKGACFQRSDAAKQGLFRRSVPGFAADFCISNLVEASATVSQPVGPTPKQENRKAASTKLASPKLIQTPTRMSTGLQHDATVFSIRAVGAPLPKPPRTRDSRHHARYP